MEQGPSPGGRPHPHATLGMSSSESVPREPQATRQEPTTPGTLQLGSAPHCPDPRVCAAPSFLLTGRPWLLAVLRLPALCHVRLYVQLAARAARSRSGRRGRAIPLGQSGAVQPRGSSGGRVGVIGGWGFGAAPSTWPTSEAQEGPQIPPCKSAAHAGLPERGPQDPAEGQALPGA